MVRHTFDADVRYFAAGRTSAGVGFTRLTEERTHRIFESTTDNVVRATFDTMSQSWFTLRTKYEHAQRRGEGIEAGEIGAGGDRRAAGHAALRHRLARSRPRHAPGLGDAGRVAQRQRCRSPPARTTTSRACSACATTRTASTAPASTTSPTDLVTLGGSYSYERYNALSRSRQANPGVQFTDPSRNWATDSTRQDAFADRSTPTSRGSRRRSTCTSPTTSAAPGRATTTSPARSPTGRCPKKSSCRRRCRRRRSCRRRSASCSAARRMPRYVLTARLSVGLSYWYERYRVQDFTLDIDANPDLVRGQALLIGYLYRPYTANTVWGRLVYRW